MDEPTTTELAARLRSIRKRRGLSQRELAELSGVSVSLVRKIEQSVVHDTRLETVRRFAVALRVQTTDLIGGGGDPEAPVALGPALWEPTWRAFLGQAAQPDDDPTREGVRAGLDALKPLLAENRYTDVAAMLPGLLRDAYALNGADRAVRSRLLNITGWAFTQTRQFGLAEPVLRQAIDTADERLDAAAAADTLSWLYLRQGMLEDARRLVTRWADEIEPRFSRATTAELAGWGRLLMRVSSVAVRDNRPGEAEDTIKLARAAAVRIGHEAMSDTSTARTFGPATVAMMRAENAAVVDQPDKVLQIAERIPAGMLHTNGAGRNRHHLDVASAYASTRRIPEALAVLGDLSNHSPQWLSQQRYAKDILTRVFSRRRTLTADMRALADAVGVAY